MIALAGLPNFAQTLYNWRSVEPVGTAEWADACCDSQTYHYDWDPAIFDHEVPGADAYAPVGTTTLANSFSEDKAAPKRKRQEDQEGDESEAVSEPAGAAKKACVAK